MTNDTIVTWHRFPEEKPSLYEYVLVSGRGDGVDGYTVQFAQWNGEMWWSLATYSDSDEIAACYGDVDIPLSPKDIKYWAYFLAYPRE